MLLMIRKGIRAGICHAIYWYVKANNRCMKNYDKKEESSYLKFWEVNNLYGRAVSQKLLKMMFSGLKKHLNLINIL